jgi:hypothetical protein
MSIVKQSAIIYLYEDHHGLLVETCYPVPPRNVIERTLEKGLTVSIIARDTNYIYTWNPDRSCKCDFKNGVVMTWWARPSLQNIINGKNNAMFHQIYSDGSIVSRDKNSRLYNWASPNEFMVIHGEVIESSIYPIYTPNGCHCQVCCDDYSDDGSGDGYD